MIAKRNNVKNAKVLKMAERYKSDKSGLLPGYHKFRT